MFTFNGKHADEYGVKVVAVNRNPLPAIENTLVEAPNRNGAYYGKNRIKPRDIEIDVKVHGDSEADLRDKVRAIGAWLYTTKPATLIFDDEPNKVYEAVINGAEIEEVLKLGDGSIKFICPQPYAVDAVPTIQTLIAGANTVTVGGTATVVPKVTVLFNASATEISYDIGVDENNRPQQLKVVGTFITGDVLIIDHSKGYVTLNGSNAMPILSLDSDFFDIVSGANTLNVDAGTATVQVEYKNRWL